MHSIYLILDFSIFTKYIIIDQIEYVFKCKGKFGEKVIDARKKYLGNRIDIGWKHEMDVDGNDKSIKCKYCEKLLMEAYINSKII